MLFFLSAFAARLAMAAPPDTDALAAWFAAATTVTLSLQPDGQPLQVAEGDTWQTLHEQVVSRDGGTLRAGAQ